MSSTTKRSGGFGWSAKHISTVARQFKRTFSQQALNALGKAIRFCMREREIRPYRLALGLIEVFARTRVETIADAHRAFNALCDTLITEPSLWAWDVFLVPPVTK